MHIDNDKVTKSIKCCEEFIYSGSRLFLKHYFHNQSSIGKCTRIIGRIGIETLIEMPISSDTIVILL